MNDIFKNNSKLQKLIDDISEPSRRLNKMYDSMNAQSALLNSMETNMLISNKVLDSLALYKHLSEQIYPPQFSSLKDITTNNTSLTSVIEQIKLQPFGLSLALDNLFPKSAYTDHNLQAIIDSFSSQFSYLNDLKFIKSGFDREAILGIHKFAEFREMMTNFHPYSEIVSEYANSELIYPGEFKDGETNEDRDQNAINSGLDENYIIPFTDSADYDIMVYSILFETTPDAMYDYVETSQLIALVEIALRKLILPIMIKTEGENWAKSVFGTDGYKKINERMGEYSRQFNFIEFLDFGDYIRFFEQRKFWPHFEPCFKRKEDIIESLKRLMPFRKDQAHS